MHEYEQDADVAADALQRVAPVVPVSVLGDIDLPGAGKPYAQHRVKDDGQEQDAPFDQDQEWQIVDELNFMLESGDAGIPDVLRCVEVTTPDDR